jgi:diguanylate cyclase (GGDEF)-like protein/PAS domain S-box-containing protein/putative nucleotidyltransferase with HDIG domain
MQQHIAALHQLAGIATQGFADEQTLTQAATIIRQATGAAEAMVVYAQDKNFLTCSDASDGPPTELTLAALAWVQRHAAQTNEPVAFNLMGNRVQDFTSALSDDDRQFLAFTVPTSESAAEMCILRGNWDHKARPRILRFMQSATPALTIILERLLNANRGQRLGEQLRTLANAAQMLTRSEDVETALRDLATAISASTGFEYIVNIDLYDATTNRFFLRVLSEQRYTSGTFGQFWGTGLNPDRIDPWNAEVMTTLQPVLRPDMQNDPVYPEHVRKFFAQSLLRSTADFPLLFQDEFLGAMAFVSFKPRTFPPDEVSLLQGFVAQAATAIKALQMHKEVERYAQELKRAADQYIATTNLTGDVICRLDQRGNWTFLNDAACQFFGKPREELLGTNSRDFLHPDEVELTAQAIRQMRANKKPVSGFANRHVTPMGIRVVEWNGYPLFDEDGQYTGIQITGRDISERKKMEEERERLHSEMAERAITDSLTGLYNHAHFYQRLAEEVERSKRYKRRFAVVMMDVDAFKQYNDSRGHQAGDDALRLLADSIRTGIRGSDLAFRYGGDEFATILLSADSARAQSVVNRINKRIAAGLKKMDPQAAAWLGLSAGVASFPEDATTVDELVQMADAALYNAKHLAWARSLTEGEQDIESQAYPHKLVHEAQTGMLTTAAGSLATVLHDLGVSQVAAALDLRSIAALGAAAEIKDRYTHGHQERASLWAAALAEDMGLPSEQVRDIRIAGLLHDIGKISVSEGILNKPSKLTEEEFNKVKQHAPAGAKIMLSEAEALQQLAAIVRHHHEHFDGTGYPDGIAGQHIPLEARIMSVVDVFDAMTHERAYRKALSREEAIAEIERGAGTQFDPEVVKAFLALVKRRSEEAAASVQAASEDRRLASAKVAAGKKG